MAYFGLAGVLSLASVGAFFGLVAAVVLTLLRWRRWARPQLLALDSLLAGAVLASLVAITLATLEPLESIGTRADAPLLLNLVPLRALARGGFDVFVLNVVLFVPFGAALRLWRPSLGWWRITIAALAFSGGIEALQLLHPFRGTNIDDLLTNAAGTALGALLVRPLSRRLLDLWSRTADRTT